MADVAFVPERNIFQSGDGVSPNDPCQAAEALGGDRVAFVRHGGAAFLAGAEKFFDLEDFGPLQMAQLRRPTIDARGDERERGAKFRVAIALDDLRREHRWPEAEFFVNMPLDSWVEMRMGPDGAAQFPDAHALPCLHQPLFGAAEFVEHEGELQPEGDRLGVNAVAAPNHRRHLVTPRLVANRAPQFADVIE